MIAGSRNSEELEKLFHRHYASVLMYCTAIVKNKDDAEDIVQQAFITLWEKIDVADTDNAARAYWYKTVYHSSLDFIKHQKVVQQHEQEVMNEKATLVPLRPDDAEELEEKIRTALNELPEQCARVFALSRFEGLKYREIAAQLAISEKTVENHMSKALKLLRHALSEYLPLMLVLILYGIC